MRWGRLIAASLVMTSCASVSTLPRSVGTALLTGAFDLMRAVPAMDVSEQCAGDCAESSRLVIVGAGQCGERSWLISQMSRSFTEGVTILGPGVVAGRLVIRLVPPGGPGDTGKGIGGDELDVAADGPPYPVRWYLANSKGLSTYTFRFLSDAPASPPSNEALCKIIAPPTPTPAPTGTLHVTATGSVTLEKTMAVRCDVGAHFLGAYPLSNSQVATTQIVGIGVGATMGRTGPGQLSDVVDLYVVPANTSPTRRSYYTGPAQITTTTAEPWTGTFTADVAPEVPPSPAAGPSLHVSGTFACSPGR